jgi:hypothetical protein
MLRFWKERIGGFSFEISGHFAYLSLARSQAEVQGQKHQLRLIATSLVCH